MKALLLAATATLAVAAAMEPADAWMRGGGGFGGGWGRTAGGGFYHSGDFGGFEHGTAGRPERGRACRRRRRLLARQRRQRLLRGSRQHLRRLLPWNLCKRQRRLAYRGLWRLLSSAGRGELLRRRLLELRLRRLGVCRRCSCGRGCRRGGGGGGDSSGDRRDLWVSAGRLRLFPL